MLQVATQYEHQTEAYTAYRNVGRMVGKRESSSPIHRPFVSPETHVTHDHYDARHTVSC